MYCKESSQWKSINLFICREVRNNCKIWILGACLLCSSWSVENARIFSRPFSFCLFISFHWTEEIFFSDDSHGVSFSLALKYKAHMTMKIQSSQVRLFTVLKPIHTCLVQGTIHVHSFCRNTYVYSYSYFFYVYNTCIKYSKMCKKAYLVFHSVY